MSDRPLPTLCEGKLCGTWINGRRYPALVKSLNPRVRFCSPECEQDADRQRLDRASNKARLPVAESKGPDHA